MESLEILYYGFRGSASMSGIFFTTTQNHKIMQTPYYNYTPDDKMITLISDNYRMIQVMSRFGIKVGFGDKTVAEVCEEHNVDCMTFLAVVNFVSNPNDSSTIHLNEISIRSILQYLRSSHIYFLEYLLPEIRRKLLDGIRFRTSDVSILILKFFDEYSFEVRTHMEYEENHVFDYVHRLLDGIADPNFKISTYSDHHEEVTSKLRELKTLIIRYCPESADVNLLNAALFDICQCKQELDSHSKVENMIFIPTIEALETKISSREGCNPQ